MKNKAAQALVKRRNKIYGKEWLVANAKKAAAASVKSRTKVADKQQ